MNTSFLFAGALTMLLAAVHSLLGERLIFQHIAKGAAREAEALGLFSARRWASLRSTWHLVSLLACGVAVLFVMMGLPWTQGDRPQAFGALWAITFLVCAVYWLAGTRGKHPGWIVMLAVAALALFGMRG